MERESAHQFVGSSSVRMDVVSRLSTAEATTTDLIEALEASESAIYDALSNLEARGLVYKGEDTWRLTAHGQLVADSIDQRRAMDRLVETDPEYWNNHRTDVLPQEFRQRLHEVSPYDVVRGEPPQVNRHARVIAERMGATDSCRMVSPIYLRAHEPYIPNSPETKMLLTRGVIDSVVDHIENGGREMINRRPKAKTRLSPVDFGLNVGPTYMCLPLPATEGGSWNATLVSDADSAIQWAEELHASLWEDADPIEPYLRKQGYEQYVE